MYNIGFLMHLLTDAPYEKAAAAGLQLYALLGICLPAGCTTIRLHPKGF